jgi:hypothetical protein
MLKWLTFFLSWGGIVLAIVSAIWLIYVTQFATAPASGSEPGTTTAWVLLAVGLVAAIIAFMMDRGLVRPGKTKSKGNGPGA